MRKGTWVWWNPTEEDWPHLPIEFQVARKSGGRVAGAIVSSNERQGTVIVEVTTIERKTLQFLVPSVHVTERHPYQ